MMAPLSDPAYDAWKAALTQGLLDQAQPALTQAFAEGRCVMAVTVELAIPTQRDYVCQVTIWRRGITLPLQRRLLAEPPVHERFSWKIVEYQGTTWGRDPEWADEPDEEDLAASLEDTGERPEREADFPRIGPKRGFATPEAALRDALDDRLDGVEPDDAEREGPTPWC